MAFCKLLRLIWPQVETLIASESPSSTGLSPAIDNDLRIIHAGVLTGEGCEELARGLMNKMLRYVERVH